MEPHNIYHMYELDPDGDTIITLNNPNAPFAVWENREKWVSVLGETQTAASEATPSERAERDEVDDESAVEDNDEPVEDNYRPVEDNYRPVEDNDEPVENNDAPPEPDGIRIRASSKHLILASRYYRTLLCGQFKEGSKRPDSGTYAVDAEDWDQQAFLILMNIIHGHSRQVPRFVNLELLAKIAVLVDYYMVHDTVAFFSELWIQQLRGHIPSQYDRDLILWLLVSWTFSDAAIFSSMTRIALKESRGPIHTFDLPIPEEVVDKIEKSRQESVNLVLSILCDTSNSFRDGSKGCSFACSSIMLGALIKNMYKAGFLFPVSELPLLGHSFEMLSETVRNMETPQWCGYNGYSHRYNHTCTLGQFFESRLQEVESALDRGLALEDFRRGKEMTPIDS